MEAKKKKDAKEVVTCEVNKSPSYLHRVIKIQF